MAKMYKCRRCKTLLDRSKHIVFSHYEARQERLMSGTDDPNPTYRTVHDATYKHVPCPHCGEAQPLNTIAANLPAFLFMALVIPTVLGGAIWMLFFM